MSAVAAEAAVGTPAVESVVPVADLEFTRVLGEGQDVLRTASRRAQPRAWLRAVVWLVGSGLHPKACGTTLAVARDLAERMDFGRGIVLYDLEGTARRLKVDRSTVKRHVAVLRELGALVWLVHGTKRNLRLPGRRYAGTATVYGAVIPPVYDVAMGHRLSGTGYEARVAGVSEAGRERAVAEARATAAPVDNSPAEAVDNRSSGRRAPHSRGSSPSEQKVEVVGGFNYTSRERASRPTASHPSPKNRKLPRRSPLQVARDIAIARQVRPLVSWTQTAGLRRLAFALRPLIDQGLQAHDIAAELHSWFLTWRPARPAAYIRAQLLQRAQREAAQAAVTDPMANAEWRAWMEQRRQQDQEAAARADHVGDLLAERTDMDRQLAREEGRYRPASVIEHLTETKDLADTLDLYGQEVYDRAMRMYGTNLDLQMGGFNGLGPWEAA